MGGGGQSAAKFWDYRVAELEDGDKRGDRTEKQEDEVRGSAGGAGAAPADGGSNSKTTLFGMPVLVAVGAAAALVALLVLSAVAAALFFARRRGARPPSLSRVEHAPSSASASGSSRAASSARKEKVVGADQGAGGAGATATSTGVASSSAAASSLESPVKRKADPALRAVGGGGGAPAAGVEMEMGWGRWYDLTEVEVATGRFCHENVVGEGGYGTVYHGILAHPRSSFIALVGHGELRDLLVASCLGLGEGALGDLELLGGRVYGFLLLGRRGGGDDIVEDLLQCQIHLVDLLVSFWGRLLRHWWRRSGFHGGCDGSNKDD
ncbi:hypothetical protein SORBI_3003G261632 [Sorghum bicolor]|uniref:Protein kinase domain-containing protein n=2 Tax=Sorghum bicolor TaxID=4558 RepID=A0A1B6Q5F9_SORBI|nr:hypothetical protein SORBI_3003G261632 [Sorghum bicolor]